MKNNARSSPHRCVCGGASGTPKTHQDYPDCSPQGIEQVVRTVKTIRHTWSSRRSAAQRSRGGV